MTALLLLVLASSILSLNLTYGDVFTSARVSSSCTGFVSISQTEQLHKIVQTTLNIPVARGVKVVVKQTGNCCHHVFTRGRCRGEKRVVENNEDTLIRDHEHNGELSIVRFEVGKEGCRRSSRFSRKLCQKIVRYQSEEAALKLEIEGGGDGDNDVRIGGSIYNITEVGIETVINVEGNNDTSEEYDNSDVVVVKINITDDFLAENYANSENFTVSMRNDFTQNVMEVVKEKEITTEGFVMNDLSDSPTPDTFQHPDETTTNDETTEASFTITDSSTEITPTDTTENAKNFTTDPSNEISINHDSTEESKVITNSATEMPSAGSTTEENKIYFGNSKITATPKGIDLVENIVMFTNDSTERTNLDTTKDDSENDLNSDLSQNPIRHESIAHITMETSTASIHSLENSTTQQDDFLEIITLNSFGSIEKTTQPAEIITQSNNNNKIGVTIEQGTHGETNNRNVQDKIIRYRTTFQNATFKKYSRIDRRETTVDSEEPRIDTIDTVSDTEIDTIDTVIETEINTIDTVGETENDTVFKVSESVNLFQRQELDEAFHSKSNQISISKSLLIILLLIFKTNDVLLKA